MDMTPRGQIFIENDMSYFFIWPQRGHTTHAGNKRRCSTTMCNPAGVGMVLVIRFANKIEPRWGSSSNDFIRLRMFGKKKRKKIIF